MRRASIVGASAGLAAMVAAGAWWAAGLPGLTDEQGARAPSSAPADPTATVTETSRPAVVDARSTCSAPSPRAFDPTSIRVQGVARTRGVISPARDAAGVPGIPPLTGAGKVVFAWDAEQDVRPGDKRGNVLLNAHTWPDGSALGNELLRALDTGDRIVVRGAKAVLCYRVDKEVEVYAAQGLASYYATDGPPQLAIVVCSGRRLGPGQWEKRTIWFASPDV